jgi:hypothetical protein
MNLTSLVCIVIASTSILPMNLTSLVFIMIAIVRSLVIVCVMVDIILMVVMGIMVWGFIETNKDWNYVWTLMMIEFPC